MKKTIIIATFLLGITSIAQAKLTCDKPIVNFTHKAGGLLLDQTYTQPQVQELAKKRGAFSNRGGTKVMGLYLTENNISLNQYHRIKKEGSITYACVYNINVEINFSQKILIPKEFKNNTCTYKMILDHEMQHAKIQLQALAKTSVDVKNLSNLGNNYFVGINEMYVKDQIEQYKKSFFEKTYKLAESNVNTMQAVIDTPENYEYEMKKCGTEPYEIIKQFRY